MDAGAHTPWLWLEPGAAQDAHQQLVGLHPRVPAAALPVPEQSARTFLRRARAASGAQVLAQRIHHTAGQGQRAGFEELGLANGDLACLQVNVSQIEPREFAQPQSGAVRESEHRIQGEGAQR